MAQVPMIPLDQPGRRSSNVDRVASTARAHLDLLVWLGVVSAALVLLERQDVPRTFFYDEWSFIKPLIPPARS